MQNRERRGPQMTESAHGAKPRGIIFIQSDQHRADCLGVAGNPLLRTPNLNRLANEGLRFERAYTATPVCVPARCSLMSGQWSFRHGVVANWDTEVAKELPTDTPTWSQALADQGVRCEYVGRWHVNRHSDPTDFGFHHYFSDAGYGEWRKEQGLPPTPKGNGFFGETDPHITPEQSKLGWLFDHAVERIHSLTQSDSPFVLRIDTLEPHLPNRLCEPYASMFDPKEIEPWGSFNDSFENKPHIQRQQLKTWGIEDWTWKEWAPIVARYFGEIELLDHQIGRVLNALEDNGVLDDVLVVYTSDHGDMCGAHRMIDKHYIMYDDVVRIPLLARWPKGIQTGSVSNDFVCATLDLPCTLTETLGVKTPETFQGHSLTPHFETPSTRLREDIFAAYHGNQMGLYTQRMVSNAEWKFIWNATAEDELYHLTEDPHELVNKINDATSREPLGHLRQRLIEWMEETGDPALNQWTKNAILQKGQRLGPRI